MSGSPITYLGLPIHANNVNTMRFDNWSLGWSAFMELQPDDEESARRLLSFGLKADVGMVPSIPFGVFHRPRLLVLLLESGFDLNSFLDETLKHGFYDKVSEIPALSLRLLFEHGVSLPQAWRSNLGMVHLQMTVFEPIYDAVQTRRNRCRAASLAVCCIQRIRRKDRDVLGLVVKMVWTTRRNDVWNPSPDSKN